MAATDALTQKLKLSSSDGEVFEVERNLLRFANTINTMLEVSLPLPVSLPVSFSLSLSLSLTLSLSLSLSPSLSLSLSLFSFTPLLS